jgi:hypothetical protein
MAFEAAKQFSLAGAHKFGGEQFRQPLARKAHSRLRGVERRRMISSIALAEDEIHQFAMRRGQTLRGR